MQANQTASKDVTSAIASPENFNKYSSRVFDNLFAKSEGYTDSFFQALTDTFASTSASPVNKFYAIYLLCKATESKNDFTMTRMSKNRPFLDKIFKDAQFDGSKPIEEKGKKLFSKTPSKEEAVIGNNFMRALLECFKYWSETFQTDNKKSPFYIFGVMVTSLSQKVKFPEEYVYFNRNYIVTDDFHLLPTHALKKLPQETPGRPDARTDVGGSSEEIEQIGSHVQLSTSAGSEYQNYSTLIFEIVKAESQHYDNAIIKEVTKILLGDEYLPAKKFYALLLLVQSTELKNKIFNTQFGQEKSLFNLFAKQAVVDRERPRNERGRSLFQGLPKGEVVGVNYYTLLLEGIQFWAQLKKGDSKDPYVALYASLLEKGVEFPTQYTYVQKDLFENDQLNVSISQREVTSGSSALAREAREDVLAVVPSGKHYKKNVGKAFEGIENNQMLYTSAYLKTITEILTSKTEAPTSKFYALYLLLKTTEGMNEVFLTELSTSTDLMNEIFQTAQVDRQKDPKEKGKKLFSSNPNPEQEIIGRHYIILTLELVIYWRELFNRADPKDIFNVIYDTISKKTQLPQQLYYVGSNVETDGPHLATRFELTAPEDLQRSQKGSSSQQQPQATEGKTAGALSIEDALAKLEDEKGQLRDVLENNTEENDLKEFYNVLVGDVTNTYRTAVEPHIEGLLTSDAPGSKKYVTRIFTEGENLEKLNGDYASYKNNRISYKQFRSKALVLLKPRAESARKDEKTPGEASPELQKSGKAERQQEELRSAGVGKEQERVVRAAASQNDEQYQQRQQNQPQVSSLETQKQRREEPAQDTHKEYNDIPRTTSIFVTKPEIQQQQQQQYQQPQYQEQQPQAQYRQVSEGDSRGNQLAVPQKFMAQDLSDDDDSAINPIKENQNFFQSSPDEKGSPEPVEIRSERKELQHSQVVARHLSPSNSNFRSMRERFDTEGDEGKTMRMSRVKANDLTMIENSIKNSFVKTGKVPPRFKALNELQVREEMELEISRLKAEKDGLQRENRQLKSGARDEDDDERRGGEAIKQLVGQQKQRIEALEEENVALTIENKKLKHAVEVDKQYKEVARGEREVRDIIDENVKLKELVKQLQKNAVQLKPQRLEKNEYDEEERFETPRNVSGVMDSLGDVNGRGNRAVDQSVYDVEWPATAYKEHRIIQQPGSVNKVEERERERRQSQQSQQQYYKGPVEFKGRLINTNHAIFAKLASELRDANDLHTFKMACLREKCPLFENELVRVGVSSNLIYEANNNKNILKLVLYFQNKIDQSIEEFSTEFVDSENLDRVAKPAQLRTAIESGKQAKQQVIVAFGKTPFEVLQIIAKARLERHQEFSFSLFLPTLITKFMQFREITPDIFRAKWGVKKPNVLKTEEIDVDPAILRGPADLQKYFSNIIELKPKDPARQRDVLKYGGTFDLDIPNANYLMKINLLPNLKVVIQVASFETVSERATFLLQALAFLFRRNN